MGLCRRHLGSLPPTESGRGGYDCIRNIADIIFHDFALDSVNGWIILLEFNSRCLPPWSVDALRHMMEQAMENPPKGRRRGLLRDRFLKEIDGEFYASINNEERTNDELENQ